MSVSKDRDVYSNLGITSKKHYHSWLVGSYSPFCVLPAIQYGISFVTHDDMQ